MSPKVKGARASLQAGVMAPDFTLPTDTGEPLTLSSLRGRAVVLYFYPKDNTPGCTEQACGFRDTFPKFTKGKAVVLGVSTDSVKKHANFRKKYALPFTLLADTEHDVAEAYGVWVPKILFGHKYMGITRTTFVIDAKGKIRRVFEDVEIAGHADAVLAAVRDL